ncbi:MAG: hypothetical protein U0521_08055 [Anaerolineae bacterium]
MRCTLQYVVLPFVLPIFGIAGEVAVPFLLVINVLAIISILYSVRRFLADQLPLQMALSGVQPRHAGDPRQLHRLGLSAHRDVLACPRAALKIPVRRRNCYNPRVSSG